MKRMRCLNCQKGCLVDNMSRLPHIASIFMENPYALFFPFEIPKSDTKMGAILWTQKRDAKSEGQLLAFTFCVAFFGPENGAQKRGTPKSHAAFWGEAGGCWGGGFGQCGISLPSVQKYLFVEHSHVPATFHSVVCTPWSGAPRWK